MPTTRARELLRPFHGLIHEIAKFGVVGAVAFAVTLVLFNLFESLGVEALTSEGLAILLSAVASYFANRHWTWAHLDNSDVSRQLPMFLLLSLVGFGLTELPLAIAHYGLGFDSHLDDNISGNLVGTAFGTVWRFWSFKRWVFVDTARNTDGAAEAALI